MKKPFFVLAAWAVLACAPVVTLSASDVFSDMASVRTTFMVRPDLRGVTVQEGGENRIVEFRPVGGETVVLTHGPTKEMQVTAADSASVEFLVTGRGSVGLYLRGKPELANKGAYLVLLNVGAGGKAKLRLFKHTIWPQVAPDQDLVAGQDIDSFAAEIWYRLEFKVTDGDDGSATLHAILTDVSTGEQIAMMEMPDLDEPLRKDGMVALRLYSERSTEGAILLRKFVIETP